MLRKESMIDSNKLSLLLVVVVCIHRLQKSAPNINHILELDTSQNQSRVLR